MKFKRIMIAATGSGSGKTTITCALMQILKNKGQQVISFKCGPDYIDPMFHEKVIGVSSKNLDTFFTNEEQTKRILLKNRTKNDFAVLEGVMGLYDGLAGIKEEGSSYHLARITQTPIILVVDAKGMGRSMIPLIAGFMAYDKEHLIQGVLLNRMSKSYYEIIKPMLEEELKICVLGYLPEHKELQIESRHLGLIMPEEQKNIEIKLQIISEEFGKTVLLEEIMRIAENAEELEEDNPLEQNKYGQSEQEMAKDKPVIAVAKDEAFCFYYEDNLLLLQESGAIIQYFSPIHDKELPFGCNGLLLGGGYPELYARELSENNTMLVSIKKAIAKGMPVVAECGGFMYLHSAIIDKSGQSYEMAGVIPAVCHDTGKLMRFGYIELQEKRSCFLPEDESIKGHEFHYYDSTDNGEDCFAIKPVTDKKYSCVIEGENYWLGFPHLYYPSNPKFAHCFVRKAKQYKRNT